jgi:hypothetical protein
MGAAFSSPEEFQAVMDRLRREPAAVEVEHPRTGKPARAPALPGGDDAALRRGVSVAHDARALEAVLALERLFLLHPVIDVLVHRGDCVGGLRAPGQVGRAAQGDERQACEQADHGEHDRDAGSGHPPLVDALNHRHTGAPVIGSARADLTVCRVRRTAAQPR